MRTLVAMMLFLFNGVALSSIEVVAHISTLLERTCAAFEYKCASKKLWPPSSYDQVLQEALARNNILVKFNKVAVQYDLNRDNLKEYLIPIILDKKTNSVLWIIMAGEEPRVIAEARARAILVHIGEEKYASISSFSREPNFGGDLRRWYYQKDKYQGVLAATMGKDDSDAVEKKIKEFRCKS